MFINSLTTAIATLGVGKIPKAPGTWGSLLALLIWWAFLPIDNGVRLAAIVIAFFLGWWAAYEYEKRTQKHDPKEIVVDELVGMWIVAFFLSPGLLHLCIGFLLFRLFDIWKPFPVGWIDRKVPGAFGTMLDDVAAGVLGVVVYILGSGVVIPFLYPQ